MKKWSLAAMLLALSISIPKPTSAGVTVQIGIPLPPPIVVPAPPEVVLLPGTGVYVAPDIAVDLFFFDGWWWRSWEGHWYRSRHYRSGWAYYEGVPSFYGRVSPRWREEYREHRWNGHEWHYQRLSHQQLQQIWGRKARKQSPQHRVVAQHGGPQRTPGVEPQSHVRPNPQQSRPQHQQPGSHSRSQHGGPEGRR